MGRAFWWLRVVLLLLLLLLVLVLVLRRLVLVLVLSSRVSGHHHALKERPVAFEPDGLHAGRLSHASETDHTQTNSARGDETTKKLGGRRRSRIR